MKLFNTVSVFLGTLFVSAYLTLTAGTALAQAVTSGGVDFTPTAEKIIAFCVTGLTIAAGVLSKFAVGWFASKTRLSDTEFEKLAAERVNDILIKAIEHAEMTAKMYVSDPASPIKSVKIDNMFLRWGIEYAQRSMPDLISYFKLTETRLRDMILARLNAFVPVPKPDKSDLAPVAAFPPPVANAATVESA